MAEGRGRTFSALVREGIVPSSHQPAFRRQIPVAWSNLITGRTRGTRHLRFHPSRSRTLATLFFGFASEPPTHAFIGQWSFLLERQRRSTPPVQAFWERLGHYCSPNTIFSYAVEFFLREIHVDILWSGMGNPDLRGSYGTFSFYRDPITASVSREGGSDHSGKVDESQVTTHLIGSGQHVFSQRVPAGARTCHGFVDPL